MGQFVTVSHVLSIDKARRVPHRSLDCGPGFAGLNQVYGSNHHTPSA